MSMLTQLWPVGTYDQSLIKTGNKHMLKSFSNILQSSLIGFAFQFKRYIYAASKQCKILIQIKLSNIPKSYSKQVSIKLEACSKHTQYFAKG